MRTRGAAIQTHPSAAPARLRAGLLAALRAGKVPGRLLYASPAQARRWLAYHDACSPSRGDASVAAAYGAAFRAAAAAALPGGAAAPPGASPCVVGIGCGGGRKDGALLVALHAAEPGRSLTYAPLDGSAALVAEAAQRAQGRVPGVALHPLVADLAALPDLDAWLAGLPPAPRVFTALGMLPNLDHRTFPRWLAGLLRGGDRLVVSANLAPGGRRADAARILAQYDNAPARAWYAGALAELGLEPGAYDLAVRDAAWHPEHDRDDAWCVQVGATLRRDAALAVDGARVEIAAGDTLAVFASRRFTAAAAEALLADAGLRVDGRWEGAHGEEGVFLCGRP